jgi:hypothetical protein
MTAIYPKRYPINPGCTCYPCAYDPDGLVRWGGKFEPSKEKYAHLVDPIWCSINGAMYVSEPDYDLFCMNRYPTGRFIAMKYEDHVWYCGLITGCDEEDTARGLFEIVWSEESTLDEQCVTTMGLDPKDYSNKRNAPVGSWCIYKLK